MKADRLFGRIAAEIPKNVAALQRDKIDGAARRRADLLVTLADCPKARLVSIQDLYEGLGQFFGIFRTSTISIEYATSCQTQHRADLFGSRTTNQKTGRNEGEICRRADRTFQQAPSGLLPFDTEWRPAMGVQEVEVQA